MQLKFLRYAQFDLHPKRIFALFSLVFIARVKVFSVLDFLTQTQSRLKFNSVLDPIRVEVLKSGISEDLLDFAERYVGTRHLADHRLVE
jgi:hypothetical protein